MWSERIKGAALFILIINFLGDIIINLTHKRLPKRPPFNNIQKVEYDTNRIEMLETRVDDLEIRVMELNTYFKKL